MAGNHKTGKIRYHSGILLIIAMGVLVLMAFFFLWILPDFKSIDRLEGQIANLQLRIEKQKKMQPLYAQLLKRKKKEIPRKLFLPDRKTLPRSDIDTVLPVFQEIGRMVDMRMMSVKPDLRVMETNPGFVVVDTVARGSLFAFRDLLFELMKIPYVDGIEGILIRQEGSDKDITMKIWLAVS